MKLSEAIRLGALLRPQQSGGWADGEGSCALQAAAEACGIVPRYDVVADRLACDYDALRFRFPILTLWLVHEIFRRNDQEEHTREEIADWIAALEAAEEARPSPRLVEVPA